MGKYIQKNSKGNDLPIINKAEALFADGAELCEPQIGDDIVCVVQNGFFDAAAQVYNQRELDEFTRPADLRAKTFLRYKHAP